MKFRWCLAEWLADGGICIAAYGKNRSVKKWNMNIYFLNSFGLLVKPYLDDTPRGLFAMKFPNRPNPIELTVVELLERKGNILNVRYIDMLDGTPRLDLKPYAPKFDQKTDIKIGWLEGKV